MAERIFGQWKAGELIGKGGQASVYKATREEGTVFALKAIGLTKPKRRARFLQELQTHVELTKIKAPNIIPIVDHNLEEIAGSLSEVRGYIVMPLAACSLHDKYRLYNMRTELCLETFEGIVKGIQAAHESGAIHRDIKPANVLFMDDSLKDPLVSDFGICFLKETEEGDRLTEHGETVGAKFFMAPEQERGGITDVSEASDIYALGKLLHFMITSRNLYREELDNCFTAAEIANDARLEVIRDRLLGRMIVEKASERIQSAREVLKLASELRREFQTSGEKK